MLHAVPCGALSTVTWDDNSTVTCNAFLSDICPTVYCKAFSPGGPRHGPGQARGNAGRHAPCLLLRPIPPRLRPSVAAMARSRRPSRHPLRAKVPSCRLGANRTAPCCATPNAPCPATVTRPTHGRKASRAHAPGPGTASNRHARPHEEAGRQMIPFFIIYNCMIRKVFESEQSRATKEHLHALSRPSSGNILV